MTAAPEAALRAVFRMEAERTLYLARMGHDLGAGDALQDVDQRISAALAALSSAGVVYPLHDLARRHAFSPSDYLILQLALLPYHGPAFVHRATAALGDPAERPALSHALALLAPAGYDDWERAAQATRALPLFEKRFVLIDDSADPALTPSPAVLELLGLV